MIICNFILNKYYIKINLIILINFKPLKYYLIEYKSFNFKKIKTKPLYIR